MSTVAPAVHAEPDASERLEAFLERVQRRAWTMARLATGSEDEALDLVQDAMTSFVRHYADKPAAERGPLFYRTLNNRIVDWQRMRSRRSRWNLPWRRHDDPGADGPDLVGRSTEPGPEARAGDEQFGDALERALARLPMRQRQVFLLRAWEGLDVASTARALGVSAGSVKTHYFRALAALREALEDHR
ncbi:MAG: RNA polymerase sigma factor [Wenzhouxiangellaceae bacterium]|nr:RNA polymerase sigma factor [Wenzhouxiangellaceae bacterium]